MLREGLDADSPQVAVGATNKVNGRKLFGPEVVFQANAGSIGKRERLHQPPLPIQLPIWLRLTQSGGSVDASISTDGKDWELVSEHTLKSWIGAWAGFYLNSHEDNETGKAVVDQISFTPPPCSAQTLSPGILLRSGSFLAGTLNTLDLDPTKPDGSGSFSRNGKNVILARSKVAVITMQPTQRSDIADMSSQVGLIMKNGDFLAGEPDGISGGGVHINSVALGIVSYTPAQVRACILHPLQTQAANYEIRLKDGSLVRASGMSVNNAQIVINEVSGINVTAGLDEIAQFRAGPAQVQTLLDLPWKATPPPANTPPAANPTPAANPAVPANPAPAANPIPDGTAPPQCWEGNNQEQIMMASAGTVVDFPLTGRFRALALRFALSPDAPPNAQASLSILADGREIGRTPPFRAGDSPRYIEMTLQNAKTVSFVADSIFAGTKVLFIDPVAIRGN